MNEDEGASARVRTPAEGFSADQIMSGLVYLFA